MMKLMIHGMAMVTLIVCADYSFSSERPSANIFEIRNTCLRENGLPVPVGLIPAKPPKMTDDQKQAMLACFQSHGVDVSKLPPLR